jgi:hypothetical protein
MIMSEKNAKLEAESNRILAEMDILRNRYLQATRQEERPVLAILEKMESTSRRFREVKEQMSALRSAPLESRSS